MDDKKYYQLTVQIWEDDLDNDEQGRCFYWSVIQEFREDGREPQFLGYGEEESWEAAADAAQEQIRSIF